MGSLLRRLFVCLFVCLYFRPSVCLSVSPGRVVSVFFSRQHTHSLGHSCFIHCFLKWIFFFVHNNVALGRREKKKTPPTKTHLNTWLRWGTFVFLKFKCLTKDQLFLVTQLLSPWEFWMKRSYTPVALNLQSKTCFTNVDCSNSCQHFPLTLKHWWALRIWPPEIWPQL